jgi:transposase-like protein
VAGTKPSGHSGVTKRQRAPACGAPEYLNNLIEQAHRHIKWRMNVMLGFKHFRNAAVTIAGIEPMHRIRKGQFDLVSVHLKDTTASSIWTAVLSRR